MVCSGTHTRPPPPVTPRSIQDAGPPPPACVTRLPPPLTVPPTPQVPAPCLGFPEPQSRVWAHVAWLPASRSEEHHMPGPRTETPGSWRPQQRSARRGPAGDRTLAAAPPPLVRPSSEWMPSSRGGSGGVEAAASGTSGWRESALEASAAPALPTACPGARRGSARGPFACSPSTKGPETQKRKISP